MIETFLISVLNKKQRLTGLKILMTALLIGFLVLLYFQYKTKSNLKIDFTESGATVIINNNELVASQFLLPASSRWTNTGIKLEPNSVVKITASGKVHLGAHRLIESALNAEKPPFDWCSPKGIPYTNARKRDNDRRNFLINPKADMGVVIGFFQKDGDEDPGPQNPRPNNLITIYEQSVITTPNYPATLWLIVNDVLLDPAKMSQSKAAFLGPIEKDTDLDKYKMREKSWEELVKKNYWDIWYDDNIGEYLIQLKKVGNE